MPAGVPVVYVFFQLSLERLERFEPPAAVELVLHVPEEALHAGVVQAGRLPRHALHDSELRKLQLVRPLLVLPSLVGVQQRRSVEPGFQHRRHLVYLRHVRVLRHRPGDDLVVVEVHHRRQIGLAPRLAELGDVRDELAHGRVRREIPVQHVAGGLAPIAPVGAVPPPPDPAAQALLAHEPQDGLARDAEPLLVAQRERDLAVAHAVGRARERLADQGPHVGVAVAPGMGQVVIESRALETELLEHQGQGPFTPQRRCYFRPIPSAKAFVRFWISSSSSNSRTRASSSSSRLAYSGFPGLRGLPLGLGSSASGPPSR